MTATWTLAALPWESDFLKRELWRLQIRNGFSSQEWTDGVLPALQKIPATALCEAVLDARNITIARLLEDEGFRLCDSKFQFLTRVQASTLPPCPASMPQGHLIRSFGSQDLPSILQLTEDEVVKNPLLITKFKTPWFEHGTASKWYAAWLRDVLEQGAPCSVLWDAQGSVAGYFAYQKKGTHEGLPVYKGILSSVRPAARGHRVHLLLQDHLLRTAIAEPEFWLDNTTQVSNNPVFRNHFNSGRKPHTISLVFLRGDHVQ